MSVATTRNDREGELAVLVMPSPVGELTLVASERGLRAVLWPGDDSRRVPLGPTCDLGNHLTDLAATQLEEYFAGSRRQFEVPLDLAGTEFQIAAWRALAEIPYGQTRSYAQQAALIGRPTATRAVGAANGRNPVSIILPCHRVVGADGSLTGYAGGVTVKRWLLDHERDQVRLL